MTKFSWTEHDRCVESLRSMGCAVITLSPEDIQTITDDDDEPAVSAEVAYNWMTLHHDDVEEAILGDYWGDTIRDLISVYPLEEPVA